jgi:hypothetical protein
LLALLLLLLLLLLQNSTVCRAAVLLYCLTAVEAGIANQL